jgi:hypothetical protein
MRRAELDACVLDAQALLLDMQDAAGELRYLANLFAEYRAIGAHPDACEIRQMFGLAGRIESSLSPWLARNREAEAVIARNERIA